MGPDQDHDRYRESVRQERLVGVGLIALSFLGFGLVYVLLRVGPLMPTTPPGLPPGLIPMLSPLQCLVPATVLGSGALLLIGLRRLFFPE